MYIFIVRGIVIQKSGWIKTSFSFIFRIYLFLAFIASYIYSVFERKMNNKMMERLWILRRWCWGAGEVSGRRRKWISITQTYCVWYKRNTILIQQSKAKISSYELKINVIIWLWNCVGVSTDYALLVKFAPFAFKFGWLWTIRWCWVLLLFIVTVSQAVVTYIISIQSSRR